MNDKNSIILLDGCIEKFKKDNAIDLSDNEVFELFSITQILKNENLTYENILNSITDGGQDGGIDSLIIILDNKYIEEDFLDSEYKYNQSSIAKFIITQCKQERKFKESAIDKLLASFPLLFSLDASENDLLSRFNPSVISKIKILKDIWKNTAYAGGKLEIYINYACKADTIELSPSFRSKKDQLVQLCKTIFSNFAENVSIEHYGSNELLQLFRVSKKSRLTLTFKEDILSANYGENGLGFVGLIKLSDYKKFITLDNGCINEDLFEANIRDYQGSVEVNKRIKQTLENISNRDFWWLNNGITIIAEKPTQLGKELSIDNVQIVNGLQTSYSIFNLQKIEDNDERCVLVKVIINNNKEIVDDIIESTNYQNTVSPGLLRATDTIQKNIEMFFLQNEYYYDRRKNYYKNQKKPAAKIFSIQYLAQAIKSILQQEPYTARATPTSILKKESSYKSIFNNNYNFKSYLNSCLIVSKIHNYILNLEDRELKNKLLNFKLHIAFITTALYFKNLTYTYDDVASINIENISKNLIENAHRKIVKFIKDYMEINQNSNSINMAKSSDFTKYIKDHLFD